MAGCTQSATEPASNSGFKGTIVAGVSCLGSGDTLKISTGFYNDTLENFNLSNPIPNGSAGSPTVLTTYNGDITLNNGLNSAGNYIAFANGSGNSYISFLGANGRWILDAAAMLKATNQQAVFVGTTTHHIIFDGFEIKNMVDNTGFAGNGSFHEIRNCLVHDLNRGGPSALSYGMYLNFQDSIVEHCEIYNQGAYGIHAYKQTSPDVNRNTFRFNVIHDTTQNTTGFTATGLLVTSGVNNKVYGNVLYNNWVGLDCLGDGGNLCNNNTIYRNRSAGMKVDNGNNAQNNIVWGNGTQDGSPNIVSNSCVTHDGAGNCTAFQMPQGSTISNNICPTTGSFNPSPSVRAIPCNGFSIFDPATNFVNAAGNNFALTGPPNPAIDRGTDLGSPFDTDINNTPRPQGSTWDIGAYEFGAGGVNTPPVVTFTNPPGPIFNTPTTPFTLTGTASDADGTVVLVTWTCTRCGTNGASSSGTASGTTNWTIANIPLRVGQQFITVTATDNLGAPSQRALTINYTPSFPGNTLALAMGFETGSGTSSVDSSGNNNTGTLVNGVTWTTQGKFGNGVHLNGTNQYINIPSATSLDMTQSFTFSIWAKPSAIHNDFRPLFSKNPQLQRLYASSDAAYCANSGPSGYAFVNESTTQVVCNPFALQPNQWTHVAMTYDGIVGQLKMYINGVLVQTVAATGLMQPNTQPLTIGANPGFSEYFDGDVDEARFYNWAIPLSAASNTVAGAPCVFGNPLNVSEQSIIRDMNCPVIQAAPPISIKFPASATGLKVGKSATGLEFGSR